VPQPQPLTCLVLLLGRYAFLPIWVKPSMHADSYSLLMQCCYRPDPLFHEVSRLICSARTSRADSTKFGATQGCPGLHTKYPVPWSGLYFARPVPCAFVILSLLRSHFSSAAFETISLGVYFKKTELFLEAQASSDAISLSFIAFSFSCQCFHKKMRCHGNRT
jgi:hypothetical protein